MCIFVSIKWPFVYVLKCQITSINESDVQSMNLMQSLNELTAVLLRLRLLAFVLQLLIEFLRILFIALIFLLVFSICDEKSYFHHKTAKLERITLSSASHRWWGAFFLYVFRVLFAEKVLCKVSFPFVFGGCSL